MEVLGSSGAMIVNTLGGLFILLVLLRFLLQVAKADFYNPFSQGIIKITNPAVKIFRQVIPSYKGIDFSTLILALLLEIATTYLLIVFYGFDVPGPGSIITWSVIGLLFFILNIYFYALLGSIIISFITMLSGQARPHPAIQIIWQLTEPVMAPARKIIPPMGGLDFSPIIIFLLIRLCQGVLSDFVNGDIALVVIGM